ncbi:hypothetical protein ABEB36_000862 [Hypothenemus hampei]|uniref:Uncharacterized protein n=1 Tax=Hypothenemus hampei TaxID=57062 RepID=A0ABD1FFW8_HYPHA
MKESWGTSQVTPRLSDGHPTAKKWTVTDTLRRKSNLTHSPSLRAMQNYNDLPIDRTSSSMENPGFETDYQYQYYVNPDYNSVEFDASNRNAEYDYPTITSRTSLKTSHSFRSETNSNTDPHEMGSSVKLVTAKVEMSCKTWCTHLSTIISIISMAAGFGALYRLPQTALIRGGLPFLSVHAFLSVVVGLPLLFLELGIGQIAQEGFIKSWRVVPFFKGIGYVKLLAGCLLSVYYPLYIGLNFFYLIWILKGPVPFNECANGVIITEQGYEARTKSGQECIRTTFLQSPFDDPSYYGIYAALLFFVWIIIMFMCLKRTKSYISSLIVLFVPTMACYIALTTKSIILEAELGALSRLCHNADWSELKNAEVWYFAIIQVLFSTNVGFGSFITNAGIALKKVNPLWTSLGYILTNVVLGSGSLIITTILTGGAANNTIQESGEVAEVQLFTMIYNAMANQNHAFKYWMIATYLLFIFAGFISMATLSYTLLKAIHGHERLKLKWRQKCLIFSFTGFMLGCMVLLRKDFDLVHLLDHYIVGNLILICAAMEVLTLTVFYGANKLKSDFEFVLGQILPKFWLGLWWLIPLGLTGLFLWGLATLKLEGIHKDDPIWLYAIGWAVVLTAFIFIFVLGFFVSRTRDGYTVCDRLKASLEPSHDWGPKDPMQRYNWVQWNSKNQSGERDFTLKRRGTKEYTKTIKKKAKREISELSAMGLPGTYFNNKTSVNNNNSKSSNNGYSKTYTVYNESQSDSLEPQIPPKRHHHHHHHHINNNNNNNNNNRSSLPVSKRAPSDHWSRPFSYPIVTSYEEENSEGYGTFRNKGPYIIDGDIGHVCHRKSDHEAVTEL